MAELPGPYEIMELSDGETEDFRVLNYDVGEVLIHPAYKPEGKWIRALRLWVSEQSKQYFPYYWDVTSRTLVAQLEPLLAAGNYQNKIFRITKHGIAPRARFSVEVL